MRNLQKTWWILIVLLLFDVGAVLWLVAGRPCGQGSRPALPREHRPAARRRLPRVRPSGPVRATNPDDDEAFLRLVRERAEEQRRQYREKQRREQENDES